MRRVLALILVSTGLLITACSSSSKTATNSTPPSTTATTSPTTSAAPAAPAAAAANATVDVAMNAKYGQILVDSQGRTLYIFDKDMGTTSACTSTVCTAAWPAVVATGTPQGGTGVTSTMLGTAQGQVAGQVTYNGHLLYRFAADKAAGDVMGAVIPGWHPVTPAGTAAS